MVNRHPRTVDLREDAAEGVIVLELRCRLLERGGHLRKSTWRLGEHWLLVNLWRIPACLLVAVRLITSACLLEEPVLEVTVRHLDIPFQYF